MNGMNEFVVSLSDAELKALAAVVRSPQEWIENAVKEMCRRAMEDVFQSEVRKMIADPSVTEIPADMESVVLAADVTPAAELVEEPGPVPGY